MFYFTFPRRGLFVLGLRGPRVCVLLLGGSYMGPSIPLLPKIANSDKKHMVEVEKTGPRGPPLGLRARPRFLLRESNQGGFTPAEK